MIVVPCSVGTAGRIASGVSQTLIERAADVMLKERRRLILVVRETPLSLIHLRNLTALAECGAVVLPAAPSFYARPADIESLCATVTERIVALVCPEAIRIDGANPPHERRIPNPPAVRVDVSARGRTPLRQGTFGPESCISDFFCNFVRYRSIT